MSEVTMADVRDAFPALAYAAEASIRNPLDPETAEWLDGPAFVRWLVEQDIRPEGEGQNKSWARWEAGGAVNLNSADELLLDSGLSLGEVPDSIWRHPPPRSREPTPAQKVSMLGWGK